MYLIIHVKNTYVSIAFLHIMQHYSFMIYTLLTSK